MGRRSAIRRVAIFLAIIEGQSEDPPFWDWKVNSKGECRNLETDLCRDARAVMSRTLSSLFLGTIRCKPYIFSL